MPTYNFYDSELDEEFEMFMKIAEREEYLKENPHIKPVVSAPVLISGTTVINKVPEGFKEVLSRVAEAHPESAVGDRYGKKSIKNIRTKNIVNRHYEKTKKN
jgi:hypothetical protein